MIRRLLGATAAAAAIVITVAGTTPALAAQRQVCGNGGTGYCLNDWGGHDYANDPVKMYYGSSTNEAFYPYRLINMCNNGLATSTCPINIPGVNLTGHLILAVGYTPGGCLVTSAGAYAVLGNCPDSYGNGGSNGVIMVANNNSACPGGGNESYFIDRYWSNKDQKLVYLESGGNLGVQAYFLIGSGTCWGWTPQ